MVCDVSPDPYTTTYCVSGPELSEYRSGSVIC